jgi:hypothetical protein
MFRNVLGGLSRQFYSIDLNGASLKIIVNTENFGSKRAKRRLAFPVVPLN